MEAINHTVRLVDAAAAASSSEQRAAAEQQQAAATRPAATSRTAAARQKQPEAAQNPPAEHSGQSIMHAPRSEPRLDRGNNHDPTLVGTKFLC